MPIDETPIYKPTILSKHAYSDLSHVSPLVFLYLLRKCYSSGTCKASAKFRALQQQLHLVFQSNSQAGAATLVAQSLYILPIFESQCDGFSHLVLSALSRYLKGGVNDEDVLKAKKCAAKLFLDIIDGTLAHDGGILIKIVQVFDVNFTDINGVLCDSSAKSNHKAETAKEVVELYVLKLIELQSYMADVDMLIHFSIRESGESFLLKMMECQQMKAAEKWATYLGKPMLCLLVQEYVEMNLLKPAYDIIKRNNLSKEFPELYHQSRESSLKKLAEKGVWEIAEERANGDRKLLEYLVEFYWRLFLALFVESKFLC